MEAQWSAELEQAWPRIQVVAQRMYAMHREFERQQLNSRRCRRRIQRLRSSRQGRRRG